MFESACMKNRESIYAVKNESPINELQIACSTGSGFTIAPGILVTTAHSMHLDNDINKPYHQKFDVIRSPDIGQKMESSTLIAEDPTHDIALLKINSPRSDKFLDLEPNRMPTGTLCGSLGFPLGELVETPQGSSFVLVERFQGSYISSFQKYQLKNGAIADFYEIDSMMYKGSSGCPAFLVNSKVIGMQSQCLLSKSASGTSKSVDDATQLSISLLVPSMDIIKFALRIGIKV